MIGFVLAAGYGTRMRPLSDHLPKALVPVWGNPILGWMLERLWEGGIETIGVNAHYHADLIYRYCEDSTVPFSVFHEKERIRGTGGAIHFARDFLSTEPLFCICNAEPVKQVDMFSLSTRFEALSADCALVSVPCRSGGTIFFDPETHEYTGTRDDPLDFDREGNAFFIGITFYRRDVLDLITASDFSAVPIWKRIQERGGSTKILTVEDIYWRDIGSPQDLAGAYFDYLNGCVVCPLPAGMRFDPERKCAYPETYTQQQLTKVGVNCWLETLSIPTGVSMKNCIVLSGSRLPQSGIMKNVIVTPWGDISFDD